MSGGFNAVTVATTIAIRIPSMLVTSLRNYDPLALVIWC